MRVTGQLDALGTRQASGLTQYINTFPLGEKLCIEAQSRAVAVWTKGVIPRWKSLLLFLLPHCVSRLIYKGAVVKVRIQFCFNRWELLYHALFFY